LEIKTVSVHKLIIPNGSQQSLPLQVDFFNIILFTVGFDLIGSVSHIFPPFITIIIKASSFNYWPVQETKAPYSTPTAYAHSQRPYEQITKLVCPLYTGVYTHT
jgi:hypothetical protein